MLLVSVPMKAYSASPAMISGAGSVNCSDFNAKNDNQKQIFYTWMQGFMSAINAFTNKDDGFYIDLGNPNFDYIAQQGLLNSLCARNPNEPLYVQPVRILNQMRKMGLIEKSIH